MIPFSSIDGLHITARYAKKFIQTSVKYRGSLKLHGTNSSVVCTPEKLQPQSRTREISPESDNAGFAAFIMQPNIQQIVRSIERGVRTYYKLDESIPVTIYGEWCCGNIQNGVALNKIREKQWVIFAIKINSEEEGSYLDFYPIYQKDWGKQGMDIPKESNVRCIFEAPIYDLEINFQSETLLNNAVELTNKLTNEIEACCPWGKLHGIEGMGEGIVWIPLEEHWGNTDLFFKTKGEKHKNVKQNKRNKSVLDPEVIEGVEKFVQYSLTENRLKQAVDFLREMNYDVDIRSTGHFLKWIAGDIERECRLELEDNDLKWNQVAKEINKKAIAWFKDQLILGKLD